MQDKIYGSYLRRLLATLVDELLWSLPAVLVITLFVALAGDVVSLVSGLVLVLMVLLLVGMVRFFFEPYLISLFGGSMGKLVSGLRIEHEDGSLPTFRRAIFRERVAKMASGLLLGLGYFWILKDQRRQGWHDMLSDTFVVVMNRAGGALATLVLVVLLFGHGLLAALGMAALFSNESLLAEVTSILEGIKMQASESTDTPSDQLIDPASPPMRETLPGEGNFRFDNTTP